MKKLLSVFCLLFFCFQLFSQRMLVLPDTPRYANQNKGVWVLRLADTLPYWSNGIKWIMNASGASALQIRDSLAAYNLRNVTAFNGKVGSVKGVDSIYFAGNDMYWRFGNVTSTKSLASGTDLWGINGNAGTNPSTHFIGTTDNQSLSLRVNNTQFMRLHNTGNNISIGEGAMLPTQTGINGIAIGYQALNANTSGNGNIALGYQALLSNTTRKGHVAIGWQAGQLNTVGEHHTYVGTHAGQFVNAGNENVGIGSYALEYSNNTEAGMNTAVGTYSRFFGGNMTTAVGYQSGFTATFPSPSTKPSLYSTSIGYKSLYTIENDTSVTALGDFTLGANGIKNATAIGSRAYVGASNSMVLGSISGLNGATANTNVGIGTSVPTAQLHTTGSVKFTGLLSQSNASDSMMVINPTSGTVGYRSIPSGGGGGLWSQSGNNYTTGNLSIGTSSASAKLAIESPTIGSLSELVRLEYSSGVVGSGAKISFTTLGGIEVGSIINERVGAGAYSTALRQWDGASNEEFFRVTSNGTAGSNAVGIGGSPAASAKLDIQSTTKGFLPPRMTATQASAIASPAQGLMLFVTTTNATFTVVGWWGWNGSGWGLLGN